MWSLLGRWKAKKAVSRWNLEYKYEDINVLEKAFFGYRDRSWHTEQGFKGQWLIAKKDCTLEQCIEFMHNINEGYSNNKRVWRLRNTYSGELIPGELFG